MALAWNPSDPAVQARVRTLWDGGWTVNQIAAEFGTSKNAIVGKVHRMCLTGRPSPIRRDGAAKPRVVRAHPASVLQRFAPIDGATAREAPEKRAPSPRAATAVARIFVPAPAPVTPGARPTGRTCEWPMWPDAGRPPKPLLYCGKPERHRAAGAALVGPCWCKEHAKIGIVRVSLGYASVKDLERLSKSAA